jgi:hypothetical protein
VEACSIAEVVFFSTEEVAFRPMSQSRTLGSADLLARWTLRVRVSGGGGGGCYCSLQRGERSMRESDEMQCKQRDKEIRAPHTQHPNHHSLKGVQSARGQHTRSDGWEEVCACRSGVLSVCGVS